MAGNRSGLAGARDRLPLEPWRRRGSFAALAAQIGLVLAVVLLSGSVPRAQEQPFDWDQPFAQPYYLVHITKTSTLEGPVEQDVYILYGVPPENGVLLTADGMGGNYINEAELAGGPFTTPREVCAGVEGLDPEKLALWREQPHIPDFDCDELSGSKECTDYCKQYHNPHAVGLVVDDECTCKCGPGYEPDITLTCIPSKELCDSNCRDYHGPEAYGRVRQGICMCYCPKGTKADPTLVCEKDCLYVCQQQLGPDGTGSGEYPDCKCQCKKGYEPSALLGGACTEGCDSVCQKEYGPGAVKTGGEPPSDCECDCKGPAWQWNQDKTRCVLAVEQVCDEDQRCEPDDGENCQNCADCDCRNREPFTACSSDPAHPPAPLGYYDQAGCYVPDVKQYKADECRKLQKTTQECVEAVLALGLYQMNHRTGWPGSLYPADDDKIGVGTNVGKYLQQLGYVDANGVENGAAYVTPPMDALQQRCKSYMTMYEEYCGKPFYEQPPASWLFKARPGSQAVGMENQAWMYGPGGIHYTGGPASVTTPNGQVVYQSEFEMEVDQDGTTAINLLDGHAAFYSLTTGGEAELTSGQGIVVDAEGQPSLPAELDAAAMDRWWERSSLTGQIAAGVTCLLALLMAAAALLGWQVVRRRPHGLPAGAAAATARPAMPAAPRTPAGGQIVVTQGQASPRRLDLDRPVVTIGRSAASDLVLSDPLVSRQHAQVRWQGGRAVLYDLGSTHGTYLNGQRLAGPQPLSDGDLVHLGSSELAVALGKGGGPAAPRALRQGRLVVSRGQSQPSVLELGRKPAIYLGRSRDNDVVIAGDAQVSRRHAQILPAAQGYEIVDLGSTTGTYVNGQRVGRAPLGPGARIRVGNTEFVIEA